MLIFDVEISDFDENTLERYCVAANDAVEAGICGRLLYEAVLSSLVESEEGIVEENPWFVSSVSYICPIHAFASNRKSRLADQGEPSAEGDDEELLTEWPLQAN